MFYRTDKTLLTAKEKLDRAYNTAFTRGIDLTKLRVWQKLVQYTLHSPVLHSHSTT